MQAIMKFTYLGIDSFVGKKDPSKTFYNLNLLQGSEVVKIFLETGQETIFEQLQIDKFDELEAVVAFSLGTDKYGAKINFKLMSVTPLMPEIPFEQKEPDKEPDKDLNKNPDKEADKKLKSA